MMARYSAYYILLFFVVTAHSNAQHSLSATVRYEFGVFENAISISGNVLGDVYVLDASTNLLHKFWNDGKEHKIIGGKGWGTTEFDEPKNVCAVFPLNVYVADAGNRRIQKYDNQLNYIQSINQNVAAKEGAAPQAWFPIATALSPHGEIFILDSDGKRIIKCNSQTVVEKEISLFTLGKGRLQHPKDIAALSNGSIAVLDEEKIIFIDAYGNYNSTILFDTTFHYQSLSANGNAAVRHHVQRDNSRRDVRSPEGMASPDSFGGFPLIAVAPHCITFFSTTGEEREFLQSSSLFGLSGVVEFRDAMLVDSQLLILLANKVLVVDIHRKNKSDK